MAKAPVMGRAKTRLAADIGVTHAKRIYRAMMGQVIRNVQDPRWDTVLAVTPPGALGQVPDWEGTIQIPQVSGSLSPRLAAIFTYNGPIVVIGTDCPQVGAPDIAKAFKALASSRAVFGPASDGGFWLMGMRGPIAAQVFEDVRWSHKDTLADITRNIGGPVHKLRILTDVDDLKALRASRQLGLPRY